MLESGAGDPCQCSPGAKTFRKERKLLSLSLRGNCVICCWEPGRVCCLPISLFNKNLCTWLCPLVWASQWIQLRCQWWLPGLNFRGRGSASWVSQKVAVGLSHCLASLVSRVLEAVLQPFPCGPLSAWDSSQLSSWLGQIDWVARAGECLGKVEATVFCNLILEVTSHYFYCVPLKEARSWAQSTLKERKLHKGVGLVRSLQRQRTNRMY